MKVPFQALRHVTVRQIIGKGCPRRAEKPILDWPFYNHLASF